MVSGISSLSSNSYMHAITNGAQQNAARVDSDGDHDNSPAGDVEKAGATAKSMSTTVGTIINTHA